MKRILTIAIATFFITLSAKGQNLLFIGDQSYQSTENYTLQSNALSIGSLDVLFAKDANTALFVVSKISLEGLEISGQLIIYLNDGTVIKLKQKGSDFVDNTSKAMYHLSDRELNLMKNSNINTVRYTLEHDELPSHRNEGSYTASNDGDSKIDFTVVVSDFFDL